MKHKKIITLLLVFLLLLGCGGSKKDDSTSGDPVVKSEKLEDFSAYAKRFEELIEKADGRSNNLLYRSFSLSIREADFDLTLSIGDYGSYRLVVYFDTAKDGEIPSDLDLDLLLNLTNLVGTEKLSKEAFKDFLFADEKKYKPSDYDEMKEIQTDLISYKSLIIDEKIDKEISLRMYESIGSISVYSAYKSDQDFLTFRSEALKSFSAAERTLWYYSYSEYYEAETKDRGNITYNFTGYGKNEINFMSTDIDFSLDFTNYLEKEDDALKFLDVELFVTLGKVVKPTFPTAKEMKEFLQDKSGKYDDSDEDWLKVAKTLELNSENGDFMYYHLSNSLYEILSCHYYSNN